MNSWNISGRLTKDPELRRSTAGTAVTSFTVAVDRRYADKEGNKGTDFIPCVAWKKAAETICQYMRKGSYISIRGSGQIREYTDKNGNKRQVTENVVDEFEFGPRSDSNTGYEQNLDNDEDLPF